MSQYYEEIIFKHAEHLLSAISPWSTNLSLRDFIFRGHSNDEVYKLIPSSLRLENKIALLQQAKWNVDYYLARNFPDNEFHHTQIEFRIIREFYRIANIRGLPVPQSKSIRDRLAMSLDHHSPLEFLMGDSHWVPDSLLEITALAQHYGLMTRLLDWTYDPFTAAFFAAHGEHNSGNISIWCLNKEGLGLFDGSATSSNLKLVTPPYSANPNLAAQSGVFTHWPIMVKSEIDNDIQYVDRTPLDELILDYIKHSRIKPDKPVLIKIKLPRDQVPLLRILLIEHGYGHSKLFPGYSGVADEIKTSGKMIQIPI